MRALIVGDGSAPHVLAAARSLGRAGWGVGLGAPGRDDLATASRFCRAVHRVPRVEDGVEPFLAGVRAAVSQGGYGMVFGADDIELMALSAHRDETGALVPLAPHAVVRRATDKLDLVRDAAAVGLSTPTTTPATETALREVAYPILVKARLHWTPGRGQRVRHLPVRVCAGPHQARERADEMRAAGGDPLLQARILGRGTALSVVLDRDGALLAASRQRTLRSAPDGRSSRAETIALDARLLEQVVAYLRRVGWFGLANLQFVESAGTPPHLIDLNGRFYGSLGLAVSAGADLPAIWADAAVGRPRGVPSLARAGVRFQSLPDDLARARRERRGGLLRDVLHTLAYAPRASHSRWDPRDPRPALAEVARRGRRLAGWS